ncbi:hypothetical protein [Alkalihalobacterium bogoriense]|uniref:hypothetical protein n=1 Tax=Alkalihalobacterium bogoriense TaxID=246272 RepID=UPI0012EB721B|nr:hypothetical protein [Alkalihalobacterium bogoriense]
MVRDFDLMDGGDPMTQPMFSCETCGGEMDPGYYKGVHEVEYSTVQAFRFAGNKKGLSEVGFLTQFFCF